MEGEQTFTLYEKRKKRWVFFVAGGSVAVLWVVFTAITLFLPPYDFPSDTIFEVRSGQSVLEISNALEENNVIRASSLFVLVIRLFGQEHNLKAGLYYFEQPLSLVDVMYRLTDGNYEVSPFRATILEGATIYGIGLFFEQKGFFFAQDFWKAAGLPSEHYGSEGVAYLPLEEDYSIQTPLLAFKPEGQGLEGFLFPDTYFFPPSITPEGVIHAMLKNFDKKITSEIQEEIASFGKDFYQILIMASILEREAFNGDDGRIISGILWKRLAEGFPLQVDAVLSYITGHGSFELAGDDFDIDSPYNVYARAGLPPAPISNPGIEAIKSAIHPKDTEYWYYLHDANGHAYYARTFEEHKLNKEKYLRY